MRSIKHIGLGILTFALGLAVCRVLGIFWRIVLTMIDPAKPPKANIVGDIFLGLACTAMVVIIVGMLGWAAKSIGEELEFRYHNWKNK